MINFEINNLTKVKVDKKFLKKVAQKTSRILSLNKFGIKEISIVLTGDAKIKELNKKYLNKDRITDVLAFDYGEIFICLPQAKKQAKGLGNIFKKEIAILLIHGLLHLVGYNDKNSKSYNIMLKKQNQIWEKIIS